MALTYHQSNLSASQPANAFTASVEADLFCTSIKGSVSAPATKHGMAALRMICLTVLALAGMVCGTYTYTHHLAASALTQPTERKVELAPAALTPPHSQNPQPRLRRTHRKAR